MACKTYMTCDLCGKTTTPEESVRVSLPPESPGVKSALQKFFGVRSWVDIEADICIECLKAIREKRKEQIIQEEISNK